MRFWANYKGNAVKQDFRREPAPHVVVQPFGGRPVGAPPPPVPPADPPLPGRWEVTNAEGCCAFPAPFAVIVAASPFSERLRLPEVEVMQFMLLQLLAVVDSPWMKTGSARSQRAAAGNGRAQVPEGA